MKIKILYLDIVVSQEVLIEFREYFARLKVMMFGKCIQIYATNRLITFNYKHFKLDDNLISDFEHLNPYGLEKYNIFFSELAKNSIGNFIEVEII